MRDYSTWEETRRDMFAAVPDDDFGGMMRRFMDSLYAEQLENGGVDCPVWQTASSWNDSWRDFESIMRGALSAQSPLPYLAGRLSFRGVRWFENCFNLFMDFVADTGEKAGEAFGRIASAIPRLRETAVNVATKCALYGIGGYAEADAADGATEMRDALDLAEEDCADEALDEASQAAQVPISTLRVLAPKGRMAAAVAQAAECAESAKAAAEANGSKLDVLIGRGGDNEVSASMMAEIISRRLKEHGSDKGITLRTVQNWDAYLKHGGGKGTRPPEGYTLDARRTVERANAFAMGYAVREAIRLRTRVAYDDLRGQK